MPHRTTLRVSSPAAFAASSTADPNPPSSVPSSTVTTNGSDSTARRIVSRSSGLTNRALITPTLIPSARSSRAAATQLDSSVPNATRHPSSPHSITSALPSSTGKNPPGRSTRSRFVFG